MSDVPEQDNAPDIEAADESDVQHFRWRVSKNLTRRLDQYLVDRVGYLSRAGVQRLIDEGLVKVNGKVAKASYHPRDGDEVEMVAPPEPVNEIVPELIPLDIVYEDEHFLALNKQADLIIHPARGKWHGTLVNGLVHYGKRWSTINGDWRPGILHRLDRNTTGIMLVAKSDEAHWRLARQFENRSIQKTYVAICHGSPPLLADVIDMPIGKDRFVREKQAVRKIENGGKPAVTKYEVLETFESPAGITLDTGEQPDTPSPGTPGEGWGEGSAGTEDRSRSHKNPHPAVSRSTGKGGERGKLSTRFSFLKLTPKTGRTHQLRVHMSAIGFPMVADTIYGGRCVQAGEFRFARQALHASQITFVHPVTLATMTLEAPLPPDMRELLSIFRHESS
jgi:23S rRNA pseudouridine1911/1915/1917 synthase